MPQRPVVPLSTGELIRLYRTRRGLSREQLSIRAGVSRSWLKQVELGHRKADSLRLLIAVADVLNVQLWDLIPGPRRLAPDGGPVTDGVTHIRRALMDHRSLFASDEEPPSLRSLRSELDSIWRLRGACRFDEVGFRLAALIPGVEALAHDRGHGPDESDALRLRAEAYWVSAYTLFRAGDRGEVAWIAADRFAESARRVGDPLLIAASARCLGHVLMHGGQPAAAHAAIGRAIDVLEPAVGTGSRDHLSVWGALLLAGSVAAARRGDRATCRRMLRTAGEAAERVGDDDAFHMSFGPTNVRIHAVSTATELGDMGDAIALGKAVDVGRLPTGLMGRRAQLHIDLADAYEHQRQDEAAVLRLYEAEHQAPQLVRSSPAVAEVVRAILRRRGGRSIPNLVEFAHRVGAITA